MKNKIKFSAVVCLIILVVSLPLHAENDFIVIDTQKALSSSKVFNNVQTQLNQFAQDMQKEYNDKEAVLKKEYDSLLENKSNYSPKMLDEKMHDIQNRVKVLQDKFTLRKQNFDKLSVDSSKIIEDKVKEIVQKLSKTSKVDTIFQAYAFVAGIYPASKDKTNEVTKMLDASLPKIDLKRP